MHVSISTAQDESNESDEVLHTDVCVSILESASSVYTLTRSLWKHMGRTANRKWLYLPYVQKVEHISFSSGQRGTWQNHDCNIEEILSDWMFKRIQVDSSNGVGDCFFQSIVMNIMERSEIAELVKIQGDNMSEMVKDLRSKLVKEWLGENREYYMEFLVFPEQVEQSKEQVYEAMAVKFLQMGFYSSDIGDIMPLGLSNAVGLPIVIFNSNSGKSSASHYTARVIKSSTPVFLTYNGFGDGHYDYASYCGDPTEKWSVKSVKGCSCGMNSKVYTQSCANSKAYQSRCKCLKAKKDVHQHAVAKTVATQMDNEHSQ